MIYTCSGILVKVIQFNDDTGTCIVEFDDGERLEVESLSLKADGGIAEVVKTLDEVSKTQ